eukprot:CAMPEP_0177649154 /NCGR_PEP_ID=MMETSP0447-20121125/11218_1 /TAXON_ID=0 /ORGANISM="Stygamoeba regulata, Strain BSH-02190019" /LENGTH=351 /DNA_ID=CAMNT_0019151859 /DNA_START=81 /DNA_END=1137 /DNA_ORIENTATION=-
MENAILGIGNPLLDISAEVPQSLFEKYELKTGNAILAEEKHMPLYDEMAKNYEVSYIAGGANLNSMRAAQWMLQQPKVCTYIGCIGQDNYGTIMKAEACKDGVDAHFLEDSAAPTGTCACLIHEKERSLVANLGAANNYKQEHLQAPERLELINKAKLVCCTGFFLTVSVPSLLQLGKHCAENDKTFFMNISAPFLVDFFWEGKFDAVLPYVDVLFGNETEFAAIAKRFGCEGAPLDQVAQKVAAFEKVNTKRERVCIVTQGSQNTWEVTKDKAIAHPVPKLDASLIVDTNGAGDSFVGGFLSQYVQGAAIPRCIDAGHYAAQVTIQTSGTNFSGKKPEFKERPAAARRRG